MRLVNDILLFINFLGLFLCLAPGIGSYVVGRDLASATPEGASALRQLFPRFANISGFGLLILWVTGIALIFTRHGGIDNLSTLFWIRTAFVVVLTIIVMMIHMTIREIHRTGNVAMERRLYPFGAAAALAALAAVFVTILSLPPIGGS